MNLPSVQSNPAINLTLNGEAQSLAGPLTVAQLLAARGLSGKRVAVERNGEIVPRGLHEQTPLADGDRLEIVVAVGGG
ncbi:MAG: sulfur carrier protein ThiS [Sterolibacteriaceae bacterium]|jgi:sulfur carrier protein|nr:sulfur carrier protein ThiS [Candidatus Methylophosphatis haderslevensis]